MDHSDRDTEARQRIGDLERAVRQLLELAEVQAARTDALEEQLDRPNNGSGLELSEGVAQHLGVKAGRYVLESR